MAKVELQMRQICCCLAIVAQQPVGGGCWQRPERNLWPLSLACPLRFAIACRWSLWSAAVFLAVLLPAGYCLCRAVSRHGTKRRTQHTWVGLAAWSASYTTVQSSGLSS